MCIYVHIPVRWKMHESCTAMTWLGTMFASTGWEKRSDSREGDESYNYAQFSYMGGQFFGPQNKALQSVLLSTHFNWYSKQSDCCFTWEEKDSSTKSYECGHFTPIWPTWTRCFFGYILQNCRFLPPKWAGWDDYDITKRAHVILGQPNGGFE